MATTEREYDLHLTSTGQGWFGTFALAVAFVVEDILSDGEPFEAKLLTEDEDGSTTTHEVVITQMVDGVIFTEEDGWFPIDGESRVLGLWA